MPHASLRSAEPVVMRAAEVTVLSAGGGYTGLMRDKEGIEVALWLNTQRLDAHAVVHRFPGAPVPPSRTPPSTPITATTRSPRANRTIRRPKS